MGLISDFIASFNQGCNNYHKQLEEQQKNTPVVPDHPMTYAEYKHYNDCVLIGQSIGNLIRNTHNHFQQQRWHDELIEELRRDR